MNQRELTVLSVRQPWASLLISGEDWCENRSWTTQLRGPLWIHASSKVETAECDDYGIDPKSLPTGAIIGCVTVVDVLDAENDEDFESRIVTIAEEHSLDLDIGPDFIVGPYCWIVANGRRLEHPISVKGKLNLWKYLPAKGENWNVTRPSRLIRTARSLSPKYKDNRTRQDPTVAMVKVGARSEKVVFDERPDGVGMYFQKRARARIAREANSWNYRDGEDYYRAGCQKAWELFPHRFDGAKRIKSNRR